LFIAKDLGPLGKRQIRGESDTGPLIAIAKELEEQFGGWFRKRREAEPFDQFMLAFQKRRWEKD